MEACWNGREKPGVIPARTFKLIKQKKPFKTPMPIKNIRGNVFNSTLPVLAHSVNTRGKFGAGVALQIAKRYPAAKAAYLQKFTSSGWRLGDVQFVVLAEKIIANMALQKTYARTGVHTDLSACQIAFEKLLDYCEQNDYGVAMPRVGSGLGGGQWEEIREVLEECSTVYPDVEVEVYYL